MIINVGFSLNFNLLFIFFIIHYLVACFQAEIQLNLQKRRGHGLLTVLRPKFSGVLGEVLDVSARWSGDVVSI